jgi:hypothetical protein
MLSKILLAVGCSAFAFGCVDGGEEQEIINNLVQVGFLASDIQLVEGKVYVGNDAEVSLQASREMLHNAVSETDEEQPGPEN